MVNKILMVCLGNTCRSTIAEAVMLETLKNAGLGQNWQVDSAGIADWNIDCPAEPRALNTMKKHGLSYSNRGRQIQEIDFHQFDYIFGMDENNIKHLKRLAPSNSKAQILLLGDFGLPKNERIIVDPYFDHDDAGFEKAYQQSVIACEAFLKSVLTNK
uniref:Low molecular weight phosphotyrosine protein phosphatase n=1 Tax=Glossina brevipalpis TaxID=37001 RepID=A0A1A9WDK0_9MUSC